MTEQNENKVVEQRLQTKIPSINNANERMSKRDIRKYIDWLNEFIPRSEFVDVKNVVSSILDKMVEFEAVSRLAIEKLKISTEEVNSKIIVVKEEMKKAREEMEKRNEQKRNNQG